MKVLNNKFTTFIDGYLAGVNDIDGEEKNEYTSRVFLIDSENIDEEAEIKILFKHMKKVKILKSKNYSSTHGLEQFFAKMILVDPFSVSKGSHGDEIPKNTIDTYRNYVVFHLCDYIEFVFDEEGIDFLETNEIRLTLMENSNENFIALVIRRKTLSLYFVFFREFYCESDFEHLYDDLAEGFEEYGSGDSNEIGV